MRIVEQLNRSLEKLLEQDERVFLIGEDLADPYGGAFKVSKGLSTKFPDRVLSTPISEAGFVGMATGMAMRGMRPVVEIMFGDFVTLAMDQIINHASKFRWMYDEKVDVPVVFRLPMGGRRGYGPTHSQSLEKLFLGVSGIRMLAPSVYHDWGKQLERALLNTKDPVLFVENKLSYPKHSKSDKTERSGDFFVERGEGNHPSIRLSLSKDQPDVTVVCYGAMTELCKEAALDSLLQHEVLCEIVAVNSLVPLDFDSIRESVRRSGKVVVAEEGTLNNGWGAEVATRVQKDLFQELEAPVSRVAAKNIPIGNSKPIEDEILPDIDDIKEEIINIHQYGGVGSIL